nr:glycosyl transferase family 90 [uncultured Rhodopila sp.]
MTETLDLGRLDMSVQHTPRREVVWSPAHCDWLRQLAAGGKEGKYSPIDGDVARILLRCPEGDFVAAEQEALDFLARMGPSLWQDRESFYQISLLFFVIQRMDIVAGLFAMKYEFADTLRIQFADEPFGDGCVRWDISPDRMTHTFLFSSEVLKTDKLRHNFQLFRWSFPLAANYAGSGGAEFGSVFLNMGDIGARPGLAFSDSRPDRFLVPDYIFVPSDGYAYARQILRERQLPWQDRHPVAFWRGGTTGSPAFNNDWRTLDRVRLVETAMRSPNKDLFDVGFSNIAQITDPAFAEWVKGRGMLLGPVPWVDWGRYRYQIDIDGNSSPWSNLVQKLLTGSPVMKLESRRGYRQWFYDELKPWYNYVPIASDAWDLTDKLNWLRRNDAEAQRIGARGYELAESLTYDNEMRKSVTVIDTAFRYFRPIEPPQQTTVSPQSASVDTAGPAAAGDAEINISSLGGLGDILLRTPVLRELKRRNPNTKVNFFGNYLAPLRGLPFIDRIDDHAKRPPNTLEIGYGANIPDNLHLSQVLGRAAGVEVDDVRPECHLDPAAVERMRGLLGDAKRPWIVVNRNASIWTRNKDWPAEMWLELLQRLHLLGATIIEVGTVKPEYGPGYGLGAELVGFDLRDKTPLDELTAVISLADILVAPVTGTIHIAAAVRTPAVVILGGYEPPSATRYPGNTVFASAPECSPCWKREPCPYDRKCLRDISVDQVTVAIWQMWNDLNRQRVAETARVDVPAG